jgi:uncharacterized membrane protein YozB (DUF420 family)
MPQGARSTFPTRIPEPRLSILPPDTRETGMDPKLAFWTAALVNLMVIVVLVTVGIHNIRRGRVAIHRRCMKTSAWLVAGFLGSYALKLAFLGREQLSVWSPAAIWNLRFHEVCVLTMVVAGSIALFRGRQMRATRNVTRAPNDPIAPEEIVRWHHRAGWSAAVGAGLGFATAIFVLVGMFDRAS